MTTPSEIKELAWQRLEEAEILFRNGKYDGSFYLAGYSVELMLKARICEKLGIPNLFDESGKSFDSFKGIGDIKKALQTHNLMVLLVFSGLKVRFDEEKSVSKVIAKANSLLFSNWNENARYRPCGHMKDRDVEVLIELLSNDTNGLLKWIERN